MNWFSAGMLGAFGAVGGFSIARAIVGNFPRILAYHRLDSANGPRTLGVAEFRRQMLLLKHRFNVVSLDELCAALRAPRAVPKHAVVLTFDDGYEDFYRFAFPVLNELGLPATLYVPTDFVSGSSWLWPDRIRWAVYASQVRTVEFRAPGEVAARVRSIGDDTQRELLWSELADIGLSLTAQHRADFIGELAGALRVQIPDEPTAAYRAVSWGQLAQMIGNGLTVGSHSQSHVRLSMEVRERQWAEIVQSKAELESRLRIKARHFCYPHGGLSDYTEQTRELVHAAGYESAAVAFSDGKPVADLFALRRYTMHSSFREFQHAIYGWKYLRSLVQPQPVGQRGHG